MLDFKNIKDLFIRVRIGDLDDLAFDATSDWYVDGRPMLNLKSTEPIGSMVQVDTMVYPAALPITTIQATELLDPHNISLRAQYRASGVVFGHRPASKTEANLSADYIINKRFENEYYEAAYRVTYPNASGDTAIGNTKIDVLGAEILTHCHQPIPSNLILSSKLIPVDATKTNIQIDFDHTDYVNNEDITSSPYAYNVTIYNKTDDVWLEPDGTPITPPAESTANNYFPSGVFSILAPFRTDGATNATDILYTHDVHIKYFDQEGVPTKELIFNTTDINKASEEFDTGIIKGFEDKDLKKIEEVPIQNDVVQRYRYSVGIEDSGLNNETFTKQGEYVSKFYTVNNPIYTFNFNVKEIIPNVDNPYDVIKYYVSFNDKEWIRISPINRDHEYDNSGMIVPKFMVLDDINIGNISTEIKELKYDFAVYSFKIKIEIDMSFMDTGNFVSPSVDYFECNITDRRSIFGGF